MSSVTGASSSLVLALEKIGSLNVAWVWGRPMSVPDTVARLNRNFPLEHERTSGSISPQNHRGHRREAFFLPMGRRPWAKNTRPSDNPVEPGTGLNGNRGSRPARRATSSKGLQYQVFWGEVGGWNYRTSWGERPQRRPTGIV